VSAPIVFRRFVQLVFWLPVLQMVFGAWHLPGPALIAPAFAVYLMLQLRAAAPAGAPQTRPPVAESGD
jgi:hypothetical protein